MLRKLPLIIILGSTGTGKTRLSLELAERFGGEIISADSMQVYANLNIVTAKTTTVERARVRHHLLDVATPEQPFTVFNFRNAALPIIDRLLAQSRYPIVVGGTNYYIESLLWDILVGPKGATNVGDINESLDAIKMDQRGHDNNRTGNAENVEMNVENSNFLSELQLSTTSSTELHQHLANIDSASAARIHPNNRRKIVRAIEVFQQTGQTMTSIFQEQRLQPGGNSLGGPLRYPHTILFWLRCQQEVLNERLNRRVDSMLGQGLLHEIRDFYLQHIIVDKSADDSFTKGALQTIGFKEFIPYLRNYDAENDRKIEEYLKENQYRVTNENISTQSIRNGECLSPPGLDVLHACLEELKLVTRRYSKKQIKWINNRLLASKDRQVPDIYELDTTNLDDWQERVFEAAATVIEAFREGLLCGVQPMLKRAHPSEGLNEETSHYCAICERHFVGEFQWNLHLKSNRHKRRKEGRLRKAAASAAAAAANEQMSAESVSHTQSESDRIARS